MGSLIPALFLLFRLNINKHFINNYPQKSFYPYQIALYLSRGKSTKTNTN